MGLSTITVTPLPKTLTIALNHYPNIDCSLCIYCVRLSSDDKVIAMKFKSGILAETNYIEHYIIWRTRWRQIKMAKTTARQSDEGGVFFGLKPKHETDVFLLTNHWLGDQGTDLAIFQIEKIAWRRKTFLWISDKVPNERLFLPPSIRVFLNLRRVIHPICLAIRPAASEYSKYNAKTTRVEEFKSLNIIFWNGFQNA